MKRKGSLCLPRKGIRLTAVLLSLSLLCSGCGQGGEMHQASLNTVSYEPGCVTVLESVFETADVSSDILDMDLSHTDQGYFTCLLKEDETKVNIQVTGPDDVTYKYFMETASEVTAFPLTAGDGSYVIIAYENIGDEQYASLFSTVWEVELENEFLPFLYPNQYVNFTEDSDAVALAASLSEDAETDLDALNCIYEYVISHITYDDEKAATVETGYLPDIDETLASGTGICFDYAALTVAMLRALSIPARLEIGYVNEVRHAWVDVYIESKGWVENAVQFSGDEWSLLDPTLASSDSDDEAVSEYMNDSDNYTVLYVR
ncbi:MAG: transglutaminase-like domain-containing protein [Clostridiales bacterium]|nr:transglutaminase-like domain-containing protein [Clostridiales bacterium]